MCTDSAGEYLYGPRCNFNTALARWAFRESESGMSDDVCSLKS